MNDQRFIIEMGSGNDQYGMDYTKAAARAIEDAIRHSAIPMLAARNIPHTDMRVKVTIGVQEPEKLNTEQLKSALPRGTATISATHGGLNVHNPDTGTTIVIATAAIEAFLPKQA
ncbi:Lin0512 family protein [Planktotalea arctica]|uniref:Lin0512 family protein n=1 Tax=Planktotalea arctica TaxID=1481893 RepID=UPI000A170DA5|nr:Lin0512 family protein [Planktotalea arctica]